jgi:hypothetical protein
MIDSSEGRLYIDDSRLYIDDGRLLYIDLMCCQQSFLSFRMPGNNYIQIYNQAYLLRQHFLQLFILQVFRTLYFALA